MISGTVGRYHIISEPPSDYGRYFREPASTEAADGDFSKGAMVEPDELMRRLAAEKPPTLVDVRTGFEFRRGHIAGALHAPTWKIALFLAPLPPDRSAELVVTCELGPRARIAQVLLKALGYKNVVLLAGQMAGWRREKRPQVL